MGCGGSKLEELEAVALCRRRSQHLADAIEHRYALAKAHSSYIHSLRAVGISLCNFFLITDLRPSSANPPLTLPTQRKGDTLPPLSPISSPLPARSISKSAPEKPTAEAHHHDHSNSGSHLQFNSSDDEDEDDDGPLHSDDDDSPFHLHHLDHPMDDVGTTKTTSTTYFNYAKKGAASSVTYEQRPDVNRVQYGGFDPSSAASTPSYGYYFGDSYMNQNPNYYGGGGGEDVSGGRGASYPYGYPPSYGYPQSYGGFVESNSPPAVAATPAAAPSPSQAAPPPPSPPRASTWDFLNPFGNYDSYQQSYTPSRSSRELREEEGIPDLEEEEHEVIKEANGDQKYAAGASSSSNATGEDVLQSSGKGVAMEDDGRKNLGSEETKENGAVEGKVRLMDKNVAVDEEAPQKQSDGGTQRKVVVPCSRSVSDSLHEIRAKFDSASLQSEEIGKMLEVGKFSYHRTKYEVVSSKMRYAITPSLSTTVSLKNSTSKNEGKSDNAGSIYLDFDEEKGMKAGNLSSTLDKLYIWEKKLLEEVKAEEEIRLSHDKKRMQLKRLDEKGAETHKIDSTRVVVMKLSTKIRIAIQVVDSISNRINELRDEELWPELHELIEGLVRMWQVMTECHRSQIQAVIESNHLDNTAYAFVGKVNNEHEKAIMGLVLDMLKWIEFFSIWIDAQKNYVRSLNEWLMKCLPNEQEETADGIAPFSPGRLGAPPVFVICNHWSQAIDRISEKELLEAMQSFTSTLMQVWQLHYKNSRVLSGDDKKLKALDKEDQKIHKAVDALNKKRAHNATPNGVPHAGEIIHLNLSDEPGSLKADLQKIFEAMERFSENSLKAYEELRVLCDEQSSRGHETVS